MTLSRLHSVRIALALWASLSATAAAAQEYTPPGIAPVRQTIDENGVDLSRGVLVDRVHSVAIGAAGEPAMAFARGVVSDGSYRDSTSGVLTISGNAATVSLGGSTETFTRYTNGNYVSDQRTGATLTASGNSDIYAARDGTVAVFEPIAERTMYVTGGLALTSLTRPNGEKFTYHYKIIPVCIRMNTGVCEVEATAARLQSVSSNRGYLLKLGFQTDVEPAMIQNTRPWMTVNKATLVNGTVDYCDPQADACAYSRAWPSLSMSGTSAFTDTMNRTTSYTFTAGRLTAIQRPGAASPNVLIAYDSSGKVSAVTRDGVTTTYAYADAAGVRTTTVNAAGPERRVVKFDLSVMQRTSDEDALGNVTAFDYDPTTRLPVRITAPELNKTEYQYDARGNVTRVTAKPKPGSPLADIVTQASYPPSDTSFPERCAPGIAAAVCNQPLTATDARGNVTDYSYDPTHGGPLTITRPAPVGGGVRPQTRTSYTPLYAWYKNSAGTLVQAPGAITRLTALSQCISGTSCAGAANETRTEIAWQAGSASVASNLLPASVTAKAGDNSLAATTTLTHDAVGDVTTIDGPLPGTADTSSFRYNLDRERVGAISPDPDGAGPLKRRAQRLTYNADGQVTLAEAGTVTGTTDPDWAAFLSLQQSASGYDADARLVRESVGAGGTDYQIVQHSYDARGRIDCSAVRMNPAAFGALPGSACSLGTQGSFGPDRITRTGYDAVGRPIASTSAYGTAIAAADATASYSANGRVATLTDAEGNKTRYGYDGHDRQSQSFYPSPGVKGTSSTTDYEQLSYDAASNVTSLRPRDGQGIVFSYDNLNRPTFKDLPQTVAGEWDVTYAYDNLGRLTAASDTNGQTVYLGYDALGRLTAETLNSHGAKSYGYDLAGRRTRMIWKDGLYVDYDYLVTGETSAVRENGATSGIGVLATFGYDDLGRRISLTRGNGTTTSYAHDPVSRLQSLTQDIAGSASDLALGFAYNPASQIVSNTRSNDAYSWTGHGSGSTASTVNGLNQLVTQGPVAPSYDAKGNLYWAGGDTYGYTVESKLTAINSAFTLAYNPLGRLYHDASVSTNFGYSSVAAAGFALTEEMAHVAGYPIVRRYVHGPGADEPLVWYEGAGTSDRRWLHADERGSIVAVTDAAGGVIGVNRYDEYGVPQAGNLGRFQYTGQAWLPAIGLHYYKARMYAPKLGRFMQPDPIGYEAGMNLYNYVGSDPINFVDPSGLEQTRTVTNACGTFKVELGTGVVCGRKEDGPGLDTSRIWFIPDMSGMSDWDSISELLGGGEGAPQNDHDYRVDVDVSCSAGQTFDAYLEARTAPGAGRPANGQTVRNVRLYGGDWIRQTIDYSNRTILNETIQGRHRFDPGSVFIRITPVNEGANISIIGRGTGADELLNRGAFTAFFGGGAYAEKIRCIVMGDGR